MHEGLPALERLSQMQVFLERGNFMELPCSERRSYESAPAFTCPSHPFLPRLYAQASCL